MPCYVADMGSQNLGVPNDARNGRRPLTRERVLELLHYAPGTGILRWISGQRRGELAGFKNDGHLRIGIDGVSYYAHRIIWLYMTGEWPTSRVDHENLDGFDNRWDNLRPATVSQNKANGRVYRKSSNLPKGVYFQGQKYRARVTAAGVTYSLGTFDSPGAAHQAYTQKAEQLFGEFARAA